MTSQNHYQLAKQGDPDAIALYLNERLINRCLTTQARRNDECLILVIAIKTAGDRETLVDLVRQELTALKSRSITKVKIKARQNGQKFFAWDAEFDLEYPKPLPRLDLSLALEEEEEETKDGLHAIGDVIRDHYRILEILGQGGNGITYAAEDLQHKTKVAIKALSLRHMNDWKQIELFEREAKILSQLDHPAIPKYFDYFTIDTEEDRAFYIVQELAQGQNLAKLVEAGWRTNEKGLRKIAEQVLNILTYLHGLNPSVIHRDIKPHNLIYDNDGKVYLVDFGAVQDTYHSTMARGSTVIGTFGYMAPEQFRGQAVPATDLFSLGATILFILTHRSPSELPQERLRYDFRSKIQVSEQFADWLQKMVEPDLENRFVSAKQSLNILQSKRILWIPTRQLSWKAWFAISLLGSILTALFITNKWVFLGFYDITPNICNARIGQDKSIGNNSDDMKDLIDYINQNRINFNKFPSKSSSNFDNCISKNINIELLETLYQRGYQLDTSEILTYARSKDFFEWFISKNINIDISDYNRALIRNTSNIESVKFLIEKGADVNNKNSHGDTPLHIASSPEGNIESVKFLIEKGADINNKNSHGDTPLHIASSPEGNKDVVKFLIEKGADVNARDKYGQSPLNRASGFGVNSEIAKILIEKGADVNARGINKDYRSPLLGALYANNSEIAKILIEKGADVNARDIIGYNESRTALMIAINNNNSEIIKILIKKGADINAKDSKGRSLLHEAILNNNIEIIKLLIKSKVNIDIKDRHGLTPLYYALGVYANGNKDTTILKILIANGADVSIKDKDNYGQTAFCYLVKDNKKDILKILIEKGYDPKSCN